MMVKYRDRILDQVHNPSSFWIHRISRLLSLCILNMAWPANEESLAPYFRFIEVFTTPSSFTKNPQDTDIAQAIIFKIFEFQMSKDYFQAVRLICDSKIPPMINETAKPPTPIAESILGLILRPLQMVKEKKEFGYEFILLTVRVHPNSCSSFQSPRIVFADRVVLLGPVLRTSQVLRHPLSCWVRFPRSTVDQCTRWKQHSKFFMAVVQLFENRPSQLR